MQRRSRCSYGETITVETNTDVCAIGGEVHLESIVTAVNGATQTRRADALFVFIGADAQTAWLPQALERDRHGYIKTGRDIAGWADARYPFSLETSVPGIFAAGDMRAHSVKRVASGVGEGRMVISYVHQYLELLGVPV